MLKNLEIHFEAFHGDFLLEIGIISFRDLRKTSPSKIPELPSRYSKSLPLVNDRYRNFRPKPIPKPKLFRFGFGSVILTETETADLPIFEHFVGEMDFRK